MSLLKIRLVPRPTKNDPDYQLYKDFGNLATRKFTILKPNEDEDDAVMIVLPTFREPFRKLTEMLGDLKVGDYFSHTFITEYIDDTSTDLNDFRLGKSAYVPYDANDILRGQKRWSDLCPIHERAIGGCEMHNTLASGISNPEERLEQDEMVVFKSCQSATPKNKPKEPRQTESDGRLSTRSTESLSETERSPVRITNSASKRVLASDSDDAADAQPSATRTTRKKRAINVRTSNENNNDQVPTDKPETPGPSRSSRPQPYPAVVGAGNGKLAYSKSEDMAILHFLDEFNLHRNVGGYAPYKEMAKVLYFKLRGRTHQGLWTRFKTHIKPIIETILVEKPEMLQRFKEGIKWAKKNPGLPSPPFEKEPPKDWKPRARDD